MSKQETKPWVPVSNIREDTTLDLEMIAPQISSLADEWQSKGNIMWSYSFDEEQSLSPSVSWTPDTPGKYTATIFVWNSLDNPMAPSPPVEFDIVVSENNP